MGSGKASTAHVQAGREYAGRVHFVVMGCGRVGSRLASTLDEIGHSVAVIDQQVASFKRLGTRFEGTTVQGIGFDRDALLAAGIEQAQAFAAVSSGDNSNIVAARVAREKFDVERVVARIYDPRRAAIYARLGIPTVATVAWSTEQIMRHLLPAPPEQMWSDETGAVVIHHVNLDRSWYGRRAEDLTFGLPSRVAMIYREGGVIIPTAGSVLQEGDDPVMISAKESVDEVNEHCANKAVDPQ
jgi:trk system potassium uptake protein TrkA